MKSLGRLVLLSAFAVTASAAHAAITNLGVANQFGAFIFNDATTTGGHSEGAMAVGHNWNMKYEVYNNSNFANYGSLTNAKVIVGNNLTVTGDPARVMNGNAYVGTAISGNLDVQNGGQKIVGNKTTIDGMFAQQVAYSTAQSTQLGALAGTTIGFQQNNYNVNLTNTGGLNVFSMSGANLNGNQTISFNGGNGDETVVVNVSGTTINWSASLNNVRNRIVWNFYEATTVNISGRDFDGALLAPLATVNQTGANIEGTVIANNFTNANSKELHYGSQFAFVGNDLPPVTNAVPEPASMAALAIGGLALLRRRKNA